MLPKQAVIEYQQIYKRLFGKDLPFQKALLQATKLVNLVLVIEDKYEDEKYKSTDRD